MHFRIFPIKFKLSEIISLVDRCLLKNEATLYSLLKSQYVHFKHNYLDTKVFKLIIIAFCQICN